MHIMELNIDFMIALETRFIRLEKAYNQPNAYANAKPYVACRMTIIVTRRK